MSRRCSAFCSFSQLPLLKTAAKSRRLPETHSSSLHVFVYCRAEWRKQEYDRTRMNRNNQCKKLIKTIVGGDGHGSQEKQCIERTSDPPRRGLTPLLRSKKQNKKKEKKHKQKETLRKKLERGDESSITKLLQVLNWFTTPPKKQRSVDRTQTNQLAEELRQQRNHLLRP